MNIEYALGLSTIITLERMETLRVKEDLLIKAVAHRPSVVDQLIALKIDGAKVTPLVRDVGIGPPHVAEMNCIFLT